jgi:hypothetical protein
MVIYSPAPHKAGLFCEEENGGFVLIFSASKSLS